MTENHKASDLDVFDDIDPNSKQADPPDDDSDLDVFDEVTPMPQPAMKADGPPPPPPPSPMSKWNEWTSSCPST